MSDSWFPNLAALWKAINEHFCPWAIGSKSLVRAVCRGRSGSRVSVWHCLHAACCWCMFRCFQNHNAQQLVGWTVRNVDIWTWMLFKSVYWFCRFLFSCYWCGGKKRRYHMETFRSLSIMKCTTKNHWHQEQAKESTSLYVTLVS